ncbi:MAG: Sensor histidine kinase LiaS [Actinomycetota bacterium]
MELLSEQPATAVEPKVHSRQRGLTVAVVVSIIGSLLAFVAIAIGLFYATDRAAESEALREAADAGEVTARVALAPFLVPELLEQDPAALADLDAASDTLNRTVQMSRLKIWSEQSVVLWSDDPELIGQVYPLGAEETELFETLGATAEVSDLSKDENALEVAQGQTKAVEVYFGAAMTEGNHRVLVEVYFPYDLVTDRAHSLRQRFMPLLILGLGLLTLAQVPLALLLARRLSRATRERERLLERVITASDAERRRISAAVHDGAVQDLIGISYTIEAKADTAPSPLDDTLHDIAGSTRTVIRSLRSILNSIYPVEVPPEGWDAGLADLVQALESSGVDVTLDIDDVELAPMDGLLFLRVTREALRNVATHADASHVLVRLEQQRLGRLVLQVNDDGRGFTAANADSSRSEGHLGLQLLYDLANDVGADLTIDSTPGVGTNLRLELMGQR